MTSDREELARNVALATLALPIVVVAVVALWSVVSVWVRAVLELVRP